MANNKKTIKLLGPSYSREELNAVEKVLKSGWWGNGPVTEEFEKKFARFVGTKYGLALNSCTAALHIAVRMAVKKAGRTGKIIVPALTFASTAQVALYEGCEVVFADIKEDSLGMDPEDVKRKVDKQTIAIIPVHYAGRLVEMDYGVDVPIIEDCAHAAGTKGAGKTGWLAAWSFHPVKNIAMGDGGMVTTDDKQAREAMRKLRWMGIDMSTHERNKGSYNWEYEIAEIGFKYHSNDIMSALGLVQLDRLKDLNCRRVEIAQKYNQELADLPISLPLASGSWHLYVIRVDKTKRNKLIDWLREKKIATGVHYKPLYYYPIFGWDVAKLGKGLPVTEKVWQEILSLPIYPDMTERQQGRVIKEIKRFFRRG